MTTEVVMTRVVMTADPATTAGVVRIPGAAIKAAEGGIKTPEVGGTLVCAANSCMCNITGWLLCTWSSIGTSSNAMCHQTEG